MIRRRSDPAAEARAMQRQLREAFVAGIRAEGHCVFGPLAWLVPGERTLYVRGEAPFTLELPPLPSLPELMGEDAHEARGVVAVSLRKAPARYATLKRLNDAHRKAVKRGGGGGSVTIPKAEHDRLRRWLADQGLSPDLFVERRKGKSRLVRCRAT